MLASGKPRGTSQQLARLEERREEVERCISSAEAENGTAMMNRYSDSLGSRAWKPSQDARLP